MHVAYFVFELNAKGLLAKDNELKLSAYKSGFMFLKMMLMQVLNVRSMAAYCLLRPCFVEVSNRGFCETYSTLQIIFLDEPSAGMDPKSRRHLWTLLKNKKYGRIILLTTHFMDEADILADRKAIVSKGKLRCCGSSIYLKTKFGIGYNLKYVAQVIIINCFVGLHAFL